MLNLKSYYGDKIFDRKVAYKKPKYLPYIVSIIVDLIISIIIVYIFNITWNYAILKIYGVLFIAGLIKGIATVPIENIFYKSYLKLPMAREMKHYLETIDMEINNMNSGAYEDYLGWASLNPLLDPDTRVLAAINYGVIVSTMASNPSIHDIAFDAWFDASSEYINNNPHKNSIIAE